MSTNFLNGCLCKTVCALTPPCDWLCVCVCVRTVKIERVNRSRVSVYDRLSSVLHCLTDLMDKLSLQRAWEGWRRNSVAGRVRKHRWTRRERRVWKRCKRSTVKDAKREGGRRKADIITGGGNHTGKMERQKGRKWVGRGVGGRIKSDFPESYSKRSS